jgi:hypothetical protein
MKPKESLASNPRSNAREDDDRKAEANRLAAEYSRAVTETSSGSTDEGRERADRERIASEDSRQVADLDRCDTEEPWRDVAREHELIAENRAP